MKTSGDIRRHQETSGDIKIHQETSGDIVVAKGRLRGQKETFGSQERNREKGYIGRHFGNKRK